MNDLELTPEEQEKIRQTITWHVNCHMENPEHGSYLALAVANTVNDVQRMIAVRVADAKREAWNEGWEAYRVWQLHTNWAEDDLTPNPYERGQS